MKNILFAFVFLMSASVSAQQLSAYGYNKVRILETDKIILAEMNPVTSATHVKPTRSYYWYSANQIHSSQGGFSGKLLNGQYSEFYLNNNLKFQGNYKKGLKDGVWKSWNEDGSLIAESKWKDGIIVPPNTTPFWDRVNIFKSKSKPKSRDSVTTKPRQ